MRKSSQSINTVSGLCNVFEIFLKDKMISYTPWIKLVINTPSTNIFSNHVVQSLQYISYLLQRFIDNFLKIFLHFSRANIFIQRAQEKISSFTVQNQAFLFGYSHGNCHNKQRGLFFWIVTECGCRHSEKQVLENRTEKRWKGTNKITVSKFRWNNLTVLCNRRELVRNTAIDWWDLIPTII